MKNATLRSPRPSKLRTKQILSQTLIEISKFRFDLQCFEYLKVLNYFIFMQECAFIKFQIITMTQLYHAYCCYLSPDGN